MNTSAPIDPVSWLQGVQSSEVQILGLLVLIGGIALVVFEIRHRSILKLIGAAALVVVALLFIVFPGFLMGLAEGIGNLLHLGTPST